MVCVEQTDPCRFSRRTPLQGLKASGMWHVGTWSGVGLAVLGMVGIDGLDNVLRSLVLIEITYLYA